MENVLSATEQDWTQRAPVSWSTYPQEQPAKDNRVNQSRRYLETGLMAKVETVYDQYNNPTEVKEYDYSQTLKRRTVTSYVSTNNGFNYQTEDSIHLLSLPQEQTIFDGGGNQVAKTITEYDVYVNDGNRDVLANYASVSQHDSSVTGVDGSTVTSAYSANTVTVTDQASKKRKSVTDALGRLIEVYEDPTGPVGPAGLDYLTSYQYDTLDNLVTVTQGSQRAALSTTPSNSSRRLRIRRVGPSRTSTMLLETWL